MKLTKVVFVGALCTVVATNGAMAAECDNAAYRRAHPNECTTSNAATDNRWGAGTTSFLVGGAAALLTTGAVAMFGLGGGGNGDGGGVFAELSTSDPATAPRVPGYPTPNFGNVYGDVGTDVDDAQLGRVRDNPIYAQNLVQYNEIGAAYSLARGWTGNGVTIAVLDSAEKYWHANMVAHIAGAAIAPNAKIERHQITRNSVDFLPWNDIGNAISTAAQTADIINNSWNISNGADTIHSREHIATLTDNTFIQSISNAAHSGTIFVWGAGNDGAAQSGAMSILPKFMPELRGRFINVVAWDSNTGALADYSNACGITKQWCITAPGSGVTDGKYTASGTSFAAPMVSAAVAVVKEMFPYLTPEQITEILFVTATDLGAPGVDEIYGHGMLNLERATRPVGAATITAANGTVMPLRTAHVPGNIAKKIQSSNLTFAFFDGFGRAFETRLADNIAIRNRGLGFDRLRGDDRMAVSLGNFEFGFMKNDFLGADGFLQTDGRTTTSFIASTGEFEIGGISLFHRAQIGTANAHPAPESMIAEFSNIYTATVSVGASVGDFRVSVSAPDTIIGGEMTMRMPMGRTNAGTIITRDQRISIASAPAIEYQAAFKSMTIGFIDNPVGTDEIYVFAKTKFVF